MAFDFTNFHQAAAWVLSHSYLFVFLVMCYEGPITTAAAGFAAATGYFNPWIVLVMSIAGDLIPDTIYYYTGYFGRSAVVKKISRRQGFTQTRFDNLEKKLKNHFGKTMVALKLTPFISTVGYIFIGYLRLPFSWFTAYSAAVTVPKSIIFLLLGYFFGRLFNIDQYLHYAEIFFPATIIVAILVYFGYRKVSVIITRRVDKI
jgi:membrane protein DedA with SNARE-associated domain